MEKLIRQGVEGVEEVHRVMKKLRHVAAYRTEPYIGSDEDDVRQTHGRILKIDTANMSDS